MLNINNMQIKLYNDSMLSDLEAFISEAADQGIENNSTMEKLALRSNSGLYVIYYDNKIISMSHTHDFYEYYPEAWRIFCRTATLRQYRAKGFGRRRGLISCSGITSWLVPYMVDYAMDRGAKYILFTTNTGDGGTASSEKLDKHFHKCKDIDPTYSWYDEKEIYGVKQSVWRLDRRDIQKVEGII
tara:strand:- start:2023 stop:2580 length:558 start_codon:yes stop_codon:yes gene_type:complete